MIILIIVNINNKIDLEELPIVVRNKYDLNSLYDVKLCNVSVLWIVYDSRKILIIARGGSRPCGINRGQTSIHAEQKALEYCRHRSNKKYYEIYIWRYSKDGRIKHKYCCTACTKLINKYNYGSKIYTKKKKKICPAIEENPSPSLGNGLKLKL